MRFIIRLQRCLIRGGGPPDGSAAGPPSLWPRFLGGIPKNPKKIKRGFLPQKSPKSEHFRLKAFGYSALCSGTHLNFWATFWGSYPNPGTASPKNRGGSRKHWGKLENYGKPLVKPGFGELKHSSRETLINTVVY